MLTNFCLFSSIERLSNAASMTLSPTAIWDSGIEKNRKDKPTAECSFIDIWMTSFLSYIE